jgi:hypothetical protein
VSHHDWRSALVAMAARCNQVRELWELVVVVGLRLWSLVALLALLLCYLLHPSRLWHSLSKHVSSFDSQNGCMFPALFSPAKVLSFVPKSQCTVYSPQRKMFLTSTYAV